MLRTTKLLLKDNPATEEFDKSLRTALLQVGKAKDHLSKLGPVSPTIYTLKDDSAKADVEEIFSKLQKSDAFFTLHEEWVKNLAANDAAKATSLLKEGEAPGWLNSLVAAEEAAKGLCSLATAKDFPGVGNLEVQVTEDTAAIVNYLTTTIACDSVGEMLLQACGKLLKENTNLKTGDIAVLREWVTQTGTSSLEAKIVKMKADVQKGTDLVNKMQPFLEAAEGGNTDKVRDQFADAHEADVKADIEALGKAFVAQTTHKKDFENLRPLFKSLKNVEESMKNDFAISDEITSTSLEKMANTLASPLVLAVLERPDKHPDQKGAMKMALQFMSTEYHIKKTSLPKLMQQKIDAVLAGSVTSKQVLKPNSGESVSKDLQDPASDTLIDDIFDAAFMESELGDAVDADAMNNSTSGKHLCMPTL